MQVASSYHIICLNMDQDDHVPLQEVVYKATTQDNTSAVLKPDSKSQTAPFLYFAALIGKSATFTPSFSKVSIFVS